MKRSKLRKIIREEVKKLLKERDRISTEREADKLIRRHGQELADMAHDYGARDSNALMDVLSQFEEEYDLEIPVDMKHYIITNNFWSR